MQFPDSPMPLSYEVREYRREMDAEELLKGGSLLVKLALKSTRKSNKTHAFNIQSSLLDHCLSLNYPVFQ